MLISILTLFPSMFEGPLTQSILKRAQEKGIVSLRCVNIRDFATDAYKTVDDHPYGGGPGMIMRVDVLDRALKSIQSPVSSIQKNRTRDTGHGTRIVLLDPQGIPYKQKKAQQLSKLDHLILICGHYEGVDERVRDLVDEELSIGDYVLTGGEIPAMVVVDSVVRLLPGVLAKADATETESFSASVLEYPQFTRPEIYGRKRVPAVLLSGNHKEIATWRAAQAQKKTLGRRPDLLAKKS